MKKSPDLILTHYKKIITQIIENYQSLLMILQDITSVLYCDTMLGLNFEPILHRCNEILSLKKLLVNTFHKNLIVSVNWLN